MSRPFGRIYCTHCQFGSSTMTLAGQFRYVDAQGRRGDVDRALGWCYHCLTLRPIESIPEVSECPPPDPSIISRVADWFKRQWHCLTDDRLTAERRDRELITIKIRAWIAESGRKPVCLICGSEDTRVLDYPDPGSRSGRYDLPLNFRHPGCRGELREKDSNGKWLSPVIYERLYDWNGQLIPIHPSARELEGEIELPLDTTEAVDIPPYTNIAFNQFDQIRRAIEANDLAHRD